MKILVLMPLQEQYAYVANEIYKALDADIKDHVFIMPQFMDYLVQTKLVKNYEYALFDTILSAESVYNTAEQEKDNLIIIGNMPKVYNFDIIFNFQDLNEDLSYEDTFLNKMRILCKDESVLMHKLDMYEAADSHMALHNCIATATFLSAYLRTDPQLDKLKINYNKKLEELKENNGLIFEDEPAQA